MTLQQLRYAIGIAETGSFNKAAEKLYISQPSLTAAIKDLEDELNILIFNRTSRGVKLTNEGEEFISYARELYHHYETVLDKYGKIGKRKKKFGVSTQHYSFAVKSFVETNLLNARDLAFHKLIDCKAYVYLWKGHPLANNKFITLDELAEYPCLSFEQGDNSSFYFAEEILSTNEYKRTIKANDRATMLNLMIGLNGYTLCSGIICEELNGSDYLAVPFKDKSEESRRVMEIGYIAKRNMLLGLVGERYVEELQRYLATCSS